MDDRPEPPDDIGPEDDPPDDSDADDSPGEARYRRGVGITLAVLALLGAWIAILQTNAATNESSAAREATRLASEAQTARILDNGVGLALEEIDSEVDLFADRPAFDVDEAAAAEVGATVDQDRLQQRLEEGRATVGLALVADEAQVDQLSVDAARLTLEQKAVVDQRVTWNARASQYETVMTTLAVAIFLIGFTMVVGRRLRPPFAAPGLALALFCFGWAVHIYLKPIPDVAPRALEQTAVGQVALERGRGEDAVAAYASAVEADQDYATARSGLGLATMVAASPDLLRTFALTDTAAEVVDAAAEELDEALALGSDDDPVALASAAVVTVAARDWDRAAELLEEAAEINEKTPAVQLTRSAVAVAQGEPEVASEWLDRGVAAGSSLAGTDTARGVIAQYLTVLEWVEAQAPEQAELVAEFRENAIALIDGARAGDDSAEPADPGGAAVAVGDVGYADGATDVRLEVTGVPEGARVELVGYERPAPGAAWVQPAELFYAGPVPDGSGLSVDGVRSCVAVEYRFDLYVDGQFADSATAPGGEPTC